MLKRLVLILLFVNFTCLLLGESKIGQSEAKLLLITEVGKTCEAILLHAFSGEKLQAEIASDSDHRYSTRQEPERGRCQHASNDQGA